MSFPIGIKIIGIHRACLPVQFSVKISSIVNDTVEPLYSQKTSFVNIYRDSQYKPETVLALYYRLSMYRGYV